MTRYKVEFEVELGTDTFDPDHGNTLSAYPYMIPDEATITDITPPVPPFEPGWYNDGVRGSLYVVEIRTLKDFDDQKHVDLCGFKYLGYLQEMSRSGVPQFSAIWYIKPDDFAANYKRVDFA